MKEIKKETREEIPKLPGQETTLSLPVAENHSQEPDETEGNRDQTVSSLYSSLDTPSSIRSSSLNLHTSQSTYPIPLDTTGPGDEPVYDWKHTILLGHTVADDVEPLAIRIEDPELEWHMDKPWMRDYIFQHEEVDIDQQPTDGQKSGTPVEIETGLLHQSALVLGSQGTGKTTVALKILYEQLRAGASAVVIDVKDTTIQQCIAVAQQAGLRNDQITVLWPREKQRGVPGWNPLAAEGDVEDNVADFIDIILESEKGGITYAPPLRRAANIISTLGLSLQEHLWFFQDAEYRAAILTKVKTDPKLAHLRKHLDFFDNFERENKGKSPQSVLNKIEPFEEISYFFSMFTARRDTLRLEELWTQQRVVFVHLGMRTTEENRMLSTILTNQLNRISERVGEGWKCPVILMLDELRDHAKMIKDMILDVQSKGRSRGLWLLAATQTLSLLPQDVQDALGSLTALKVLMRVRPAEATSLKSYVPETANAPKKISVGIAKVTKDGPELLQEECFIAYGDDEDLVYMSDADWDKIQPYAFGVQDWKPRLDAWWKSQDNGWRRLNLYCGVPNLSLDEVLRSCSYPILTRESVYLQVLFSFPRPKVTIRETTTRSEQGLALTKVPDHHGYVHIQTESPGLIKTTGFDLPKPLPNPINFLNNGQSEREIQEVAEKRRRMKERVLSNSEEEEEYEDNLSSVTEPSRYEEPRNGNDSWYEDDDREDDWDGPIEYDDIGCDVRAPQRHADKLYTGNMPKKGDGTLWFKDTPENRMLMWEYECAQNRTWGLPMKSPREKFLDSCRRSSRPITESDQRYALQLSNEIDLDRDAYEQELRKTPEYTAIWGNVEQEERLKRKVAEYVKARDEFDNRPRSAPRPKNQPVQQEVIAPLHEEPVTPQEEQLTVTPPKKKELKADDRGYL